AKDRIGVRQTPRCGKIGSEIGTQVVPKIHQRADAIAAGRAEGDDCIPERQGPIGVVNAAAQSCAGWPAKVASAPNGSIGTKCEIDQGCRTEVEQAAASSSSSSRGSASAKSAAGSALRRVK